MPNCKKTTVGFWITIAAFVLLAYPLSVDPACWMWTRGLLPSGAWVFRIYSPVLCFAEHDGNRVKSALSWYAKVGVPDDALAVDLICIKARLM